MTLSLHARTLLASLLLFCAPLQAAPESDALARVESALADLRTFSAEFTQVVRSRDGQIIDRSTGTLSLARPNRFRWDYRDPHVQTIVADGSRLWLYDPDLEQVTVRTLASGLGSTPAMLLSGAGKVSDAFDSAGVDREESVTWCRLRPKGDGNDFERVSLALSSSGDLVAMQLLDKLGQETLIDFAAVRRNPTLDPKLFQFTPPKGADVIGNAGR
jgi:outer membrane lipoprotein carrier protein